MELPARLEALLFISARPVSAQQLGSILDLNPRQVQQALEQLQCSLGDRGIRLQQSNAGYQLVSAPEAAVDIERFLGLEEITHLSRAALEVLAIVAYQQPITRPQIDSIRGVNSDSVLRTLLRHALIEEVGRSEGPGRPFLYATTSDFLSYFGLASLQELPPLQREAEETLEREKGQADREEAAQSDD